MIRTGTRKRASDEHSFAVRRERLIERIRAFSMATFLIRVVMHLAGLPQRGSVLVFSLGSCLILLLTNLVSRWARQRGDARTMRGVAPVLSLLDTALTTYVLFTLEPFFGVGDFMMFGPAIALAAARARWRGALGIWATTSVITAVGAAAGRGGAGTITDQLFMVLIANLTVAIVVGRIASDLHAQFDELGVEASTDALTGLANRRAFTRAIDELAITPGRAVTVLFIDLDGFKAVNDTLGHEAGDKLLRITARRLEQQIRHGDLGARLAGDEFVALCWDVADPAGMVARMRATLEAPARIDGVDVTARASIGFASGVSGDIDGTALLRTADAAMYADKAGREIADAQRRASMGGQGQADRGDRAGRDGRVDRADRDGRGDRDDRVDVGRAHPAQRRWP